MMHKNNFKHMIMMILICIIPLAIIIVLAFFGFSNKWTTGGAFVLMIISHIWMMRGHSNHNQHKEHNGGVK
jgi:nicotinamide riboside transporter PnuC